MLNAPALKSPRQKDYVWDQPRIYSGSTSKKERGRGQTITNKQRWQREHESALHILFMLMCVDVLFALMSVSHIRPWCLCRPEEGIGPLGTGILDSRDLPWGCWESNPGPLEEQTILLIIESSSPAPELPILIGRYEPKPARALAHNHLCYTLVQPCAQREHGPTPKSLMWASIRTAQLNSRPTSKPSYVWDRNLQTPRLGQWKIHFQGLYPSQPSIY